MSTLWQWCQLLSKIFVNELMKLIVFTGDKVVFFLVSSTYFAWAHRKKNIFDQCDADTLHKNSQFLKLEAFFYREWISSQESLVFSS